MISRAKETHTTNRVMRIPDDEWEAFGEVAGERNRTHVMRDFIRWYVGMPGAKQVKRPDPKRATPEGEAPDSGPGIAEPPPFPKEG